MILKPGDVFRVVSDVGIIRYLYCGRYKGYRVLYGGKVESGQIVNCDYILRKSNMFEDLRKLDKGLEVEKVYNTASYAERRLKAFIKSVEQGRRDWRNYIGLQ